jgi:hypothetical protein
MICVLILQILVILYKNYFTCLPFFSYTIQDLSMEKEFVVDLDISVCFEANGPCVFNSNLLKSARLPKPLCNLNSSMSFGGLYTLITLIRDFNKACVFKLDLVDNSLIH